MSIDSQTSATTGTEKREGGGGLGAETGASGSAPRELRVRVAFIKSLLEVCRAAADAEFVLPVDERRAFGNLTVRDPAPERD